MKVFSALLVCVVLFGTSCTFSETQDMQHGLPLVFEDDFENGTSNWKVTDETSWKYQKLDENNVFSVVKRKSAYEPKYRSPGHIGLIKGLELTDFVLMYKVSGPFPERAGHRDSCENADQFYYVHTGLKPDPHSGQIMKVDKAARKALTQNKNMTPWKEDTWHQVKVVRDSQSGKIEIYFDDMDKPYMSVIDKTFGKGLLGIGTFDDINHFDDVKVYGR